MFSPQQIMRKKGIVHIKMSFIPPHVVLILYDFISSMEHKRNYFEERWQLNNFGFFNDFYCILFISKEESKSYRFGRARVNGNKSTWKLLFIHRHFGLVNPNGHIMISSFAPLFQIYFLVV